MNNLNAGAIEPRSSAEAAIYPTSIDMAFPARLLRAEEAIRRWMSRNGLLVLRVGLGIVYLWFGALKLFPGLSPAQSLVTNTIPFFDPSWFIPLLGVWEITIGLCLVSGVFMRLALLLFFLHLPGTVIPLLYLPRETWTHFPFAPTLEGQYILKNLVSLGAALVLGGKVHGGRFDPTPSLRSGNL